MSAAQEIGVFGLAVATGLLGVNALASVWLRLGLGRRIVVAAVRTIVQLTLLGWILLPIFRWAHPGLVILIGVAMIAVAAREAVGRTKRRYRGAWWGAFASLVVAAGTTTVLGSAVVIGVDPWWTPRYAIPLVGMLLGNGLTGISLGLDTMLREIDEGRAAIEARLALGASSREALRPAIAGSVHTGMIPILNTMSVVGLVSIPGMMTGQILGGTPPELAARYQIVILFLIAAATTIGCVGAVLWTARALVDEEGRIRPERIERRNKS